MVNPAVDLYSATGVRLSDKPYTLKKVLKLIKRGQAGWITEGVCAQMIYRTDEEIALMIAVSYINNWHDMNIREGEWRVVQPQGGQIKPSQFEFHLGR